MSTQPEGTVTETEMNQQEFEARFAPQYNRAMDALRDAFVTEFSEDEQHDAAHLLAASLRDEASVIDNAADGVSNEMAALVALLESLGHVHEDFPSDEG